jgi:hypothetical protein
MPKDRDKDPPARRSRSETDGGVDAIGNSRQEPDERARKLGVTGRSRMTKGGTVEHRL